MTDILARWQSENKSDDELEREAERKWSWILSRFKISEVLNEPEKVRSMAGQWSHFTKTCNPGTYLLKDLSDMVICFEGHLATKKKDFFKEDIDAFVAWKFWEAKISYHRLFSPEIYPCTVAWKSARELFAKAFESANHTRKLRRKDIAENIAKKLHPAFEASDMKTKKKIIKAFDEELQGILAYDDKDLFDAIQSCLTKTMHEIVRGTVDPAFLPLFFDPGNHVQIKGNEEEAA